MRSMTGYGQAQRQDERYSVSVSLRAVNHRSLDLSIRLRETYRSSEASIRERLAASLGRGRVEVLVEIEPLGQLSMDAELRGDLISRLVAAAQELPRQSTLPAGFDTALRLADLLRIPDVVRLQAVAERWHESDEELLLSVLEEALLALVASRRHEGERLQAFLAERLELLSSLVDSLARRRPEALEAMRVRLQGRLSELLGDRSLDPLRLEQEVAVLAERSDVQEELDRLFAHLDHFREAMAREEEPIGRRLDVLLQEILRELNTLAAKCRDLDMVRDLVEARLLCEQLREQVQNVE